MNTKEERCIITEFMGYNNDCYHNFLSWERLIPVIRKCYESINDESLILTLKGNLADLDITGAFRIVIKCISFYNNNNEWYQVGRTEKEGLQGSMYKSKSLNDCFEFFNGQLDTFYKSKTEKMFIDKWASSTRPALSSIVLIKNIVTISKGE